MGELPAWMSAADEDRRRTDLTAAYEQCRRINAGHGRTYFLAASLLPPARRAAVHALYAFARVADEIVDNPAPGTDPAVGLAELDRELTDALADASADASADALPDGPVATARPVLLALADTVRRHRIRPALFADFLTSMRMDLTVTDYPTMAELRRYMHGSAGVIGLQLLPVFGTVGPVEEAEPAAAALGEAFQLTNFLRDVGEDLDRGRVYLPADELAAFGVDRERLERARRGARTDPAVRRAMAHLVAHTQAVYRRALPGIDLLDARARPCVRTAATLYRGILDEIVAADYAVLDRRVSVPVRRRLAVAAPALVLSLTARRPARTRT